MKKELILWTVLITSVLIIFVSSSVIVAIDNKNIELNKAAKVDAEDKEVETPVVEEPEEEEDKIPESITGLLVGFDVSGKLTDVLMVGHLNTERNEIDIISIPRDLLIDFNDPLFSEIRENNPDNHINYCKLTEVYSHSGATEKSFEDLKTIISIITGLEIDYTASINTAGFRDVVDAIGGVDFEVPQNMYHRDAAQGLYINLKQGYQHLDGDKAEQLVRFRGYKFGDLQRIQVQQSFMKAVFDKVMSIRDFNQIKDLIITGYSIFEADFGLMLGLEYAEYLHGLDVEKLMSPEHMATIPSYEVKIHEISYQGWDIDEAHETVNAIIND